MTAIISTRNTKSQSEIFPMEISLPLIDLVPCAMARARKLELPEIFLGEWLDRSGLSVNEAAEIAGCSQSYISNIKSGRKSHINVLFLWRLSERMAVTVNDFYRKPPSASQMESLNKLSPAARATLLGRKQRRA